MRQTQQKRTQQMLQPEFTLRRTETPLDSVLHVNNETRTPTDFDSPVVNLRSIKGIPQGWEDELDISNPGLLNHQAMRGGHVAGASTSPQPLQSRMRLLRDNRINHASLSGTRRSLALSISSSLCSPGHLQLEPPMSFAASPLSKTESTETSALEYPNLFSIATPDGDNSTAPLRHDGPSESSIVSRSINRNRGRVLGIQADVPYVAQSKLFLPPSLVEVLPFTAKPFAAWNVVMGGMRTSINPAITARWHESPKQKGAVGAKRVWLNDTGKEVRAVYRVGWERDVLDLEARLHETMYDVAGERHTFVRDVPEVVLDAQDSLLWPNARFIGVDMVPCQTDLSLLAQAEKLSQASSTGIAEGSDIWSSIEKRVVFEQCNFLEPLPYDSGVFDMVHIRFIGIGIPEAKWADLLDEAARVLRCGGQLEIVEMSFDAPAFAPASVRNSFSSLLLSDLVHPNPLMALQLHLPATATLVPTSTTRPVFSETWAEPPGAFVDAAMTWVRSALDYKGTGLGKGENRKCSNVIDGVKREFGTINKLRWSFSSADAGTFSKICLAVYVVAKASSTL